MATCWRAGNCGLLFAEQGVKLKELRVITAQLRRCSVGGEPPRGISRSASPLRQTKSVIRCAPNQAYISNSVTC